MEDLIKRADAIKHCKSKAEHYKKRLARIEAQGDAIGYDPTEQIKGFKDEIAIYESFVKELEGIPSAETQGEWIVHFDDLFPEESTEECSICHAEQMINGNDDNYCPNCGARMKRKE